MYLVYIDVETGKVKIGSIVKATVHASGNHVIIGKITAISEDVSSLANALISVIVLGGDLYDDLVMHMLTNRKYIKITFKDIVEIIIF